MMRFVRIEEILEDSRLTFYKLVDNERCPYDEFCASVERIAKRSSDLNKMRATMAYMAKYDTMLPATKFNSIKDGKNTIGYEFKQGDLRLYCVKQNPGVYIIIGGYKANQKKDIKLFQRLAEQVKELIINQ